MIEIHLVERLNDDETLGALVDGRIFPVVAQQDTALPCLIYRRLPGGAGGYELSGAPDKLRTVLTEVRCYATKYGDARTIVDHVRRIMDGYRERIQDGPFRRVQVSDAEDDFEPTIRAYGCAVVLAMTYDESI